jgi:hypothetical protein
MLGSLRGVISVKECYYVKQYLPVIRQCYELDYLKLLSQLKDMQFPGVLRLSMFLPDVKQLRQSWPLNSGERVPGLNQRMVEN